MGFIPDSQASVGRFVPDDAQESPNQNTTLAEDLGTKLNVGTTVDIPEQLIGVNDLVRKTGLLGILADKVLPESVKSWRGGVEAGARSALDSRRKRLEEELSQEQQAADKKEFFTEDASWENLSADGALSVPGKVAGLVAEGKMFGEGWSDPRKVVGSAVQSAPSTLATMGPTAKIAGSVAKSAFAETLAATGSKELAEAAAIKAAERSAMVVGGMSEGVQGAGSANEQTRRAVMEMPLEKLSTSEFFRKKLSENNGDEAAARMATADAAATKSAAGAFLVDSLFGAAGDRYLGRAAAGGGTRAGSVARGLVQETPTEFIQSGGEKLSENAAIREFADPSQKLMEGVGEEAVAGGLSGGLMGGVMGGSFHSRSGSGKESGADSRGVDGAVPVEQTLTAEEKKQTEAEKALYAPKNISALDRVAEIDEQILGADPEKAAELQTERESITASWPKSVEGLETSFTTEAGARIDARYALIDAADLVTSHDEDLRQTLNYPPELQPRERDRHASEMQISGIVQRLDPARLGVSADAANGAPIVGADGLVESGNARTIALKRVYQANGQKAEDYKQFLKSSAAQFGLTPDAVDALQKPVLVRVRTTPVNRAEFARQANASTVAQMSPSEQAKADSKRMDVLDDLRPDESGDFSNSRDFIRRFMARIPGTEQAGMIDAAGNLSQTGYARIRNAVLAKAYGDSPVLVRMVESMNDELRNIGKALIQAAPEVAKVRQDVSEGALHNADITPDLMAAVTELSALRESGRSVSDALAQVGMFGDKYSPETRELLQFLDENIRRPRQMAEFILRYTEALRAAGNPNQGSLLGEATAPTKGELLTAAKGKDDVAKDTKRADSGKDQGAGQQAARESTDAQRGESRAQSNEADRSEWVIFPSATGSLGIPRADMPQVKGDSRGALVQFLEARGITNKTVEEYPADTLRPTQAEFSTKKVEGWKDVQDGSDRSVLISSDGFILDGHHQWVAALAAGESIKAIQFSAPIGELLAATHQFPSAKRSQESSANSARAKAREDFKDALAELGAFFRQVNPGVRMLTPEEKAKLMPALAKLFEAGIKEIGYNIKDLIAYVKKAMKAAPDLKPFWNKIDEATYRDAAKQAVDRSISGLGNAGAADLFSLPQRQAAQQDLFASLTKAPVETITVDGKEYDLDADNFGVEYPKTLPDGDPLLQDTDAKGEHSLVVYGGEEITRQRMHLEIIKKHFAGKSPAPEGVKPIAYVMGGGGASGKGSVKDMLIEQGVIDERSAVALDPDEIKKEIPEYNAIVAKKDSRAASVVHEESSLISKVIKREAINGRYNLVIDVTLGDKGKGIKALEELKNAGYEVRLIGVTVRPEFAVVRAIQRAKKTNRWVPLGELLKAHKGFNGAFEEYANIADSARLYDNTTDRKILAQTSNGKLEVVDQVAYNEIEERSQINERAKTLRQISSRKGPGLSGGSKSAQPGIRPEELGQHPRALVDRGTEKEPGGLQQETSGGPGGGTQVRPESELEQVNDDPKPSPGSTQDEKSGTAQKPSKKRGSERVRQQPGGTDLFGSGVDDAAGPDRREVGQPGGDGVRGQDEGSRKPEPGNRSSRNAGIPAGRDIPAKSGRNYAFGDEDLTYAGGWYTKAKQNVDAVELLKALQTEGRAATREEQKELAKFVGWGSSEMANSLFGKKLDKDAEAVKHYNAAIEAFDRLGRNYLNKGGMYRGHYADSGYYDARNLLASAGKLQHSTYPDRITREEVESVKPDGSVVRWLELRNRLRAVLSEKDLAEASRSTQYAHYTSKSVVSSMWKAMERMGFSGGHVLEPGAGIGVFAGLMPQGIANNSSYTGIEFDSVTGGILKQLFPDERILVESFVDSKLPKNFYDVAVGNPPFSSTKILGDPEYAKQALSLHDYFFAKSIDRVKPGGLVMYVTSRYTMDKMDSKARKYLADRADLVGAIRLPQTAFKQNAGTEVVTDVIFLRKKVKGETFEHAQPWMKLSQAKAADGSDLTVSGNKQGEPDRPALINEYFAEHPEMVLGHNSNAGSMYRDKEYTVTPLEGDIEAHFAKAVENLPADIYTAGRGSSAEAAKVREIDFNPKAKKEGNYYVTDAGVLMQREGGVGVRVQEGMPPKTAELIKGFVPLRDALKQAHYDQLNNGDWEKSLAVLQKEYEGFTKKHGFINQSVAKTVNVKTEELDEDGEPTGKTVTDEEVRRSYPLLDKLKDDPDWTLVAALEKVDGETGDVSRGEFLDRRVLGVKAESNVSTPTDALLTTLNDLGHVDMGVIADRMGMSEQDTIEALGSAVYNDPESGWTTADEYLSGNVKRKLELAREAAKTDRRFERNVTALEAHQPDSLTPSQISPRMGMNWIPGDVYSEFMREKVGIADISVEWDPRTKSWHFDWLTPETHEITNMWGRREKVYKSLEAAEKALAKMNAGRDAPRYKVQAIETPLNKASIEDWGIPDFSAQRLMEHAITGAPVKVYSKDAEGKPRLNEALTESANDKLKKLHSEFEAWVFSDPNRSDRLVQMYNDKFNTTVARSFDGSHLTLPGASMHWQKQVHAHVKRGVWRIVQTGNTYLAHAVGSGKTAQMVMSAMEQKRLGLVKKPMIVVPNHMLKQFASEWLDIYPAARLMVADEHNFHTDNRRRFVSRVALSDLDGVVITHSAFKLLDLDPEFKAKMIEEQLTFFRAALEEAGGDPDGEKGKSRDPKIKRIENQIERMEQKLEAAMSSEGKDKNARFDELGVDFLYVDEAHEYRKLDFTTVREVKGLSPMGSGKAFDLYMKARYLESKTPGRSMVMASGTPVTNTMAELYSVQKMLGYQALVDKGLEDFDSWASMFGREKTNLEPDASGKYENVSRFQEFVNVPEMTQMFREFADVLTADYLAEKLGDKRPKVQGGARTNIITPKTAEYEEFRQVLRRRMESSRAWKPTPDEPNNPDPVIRIIGDGRLAAIDMRFMNPRLPSNPDSKLNRMIDDVIAAFKETADQEFENKDKTGMEPTKGATMMVFSDLGFGAGVAASRGFSARAWMEKRLRDAGIPMNQVAFMSDYKKSSAKLKLFSDVNAGRVRILVGSSKSMGTGVNAQQRLKDLFHLDSPWYPADLEQREGRIIRQGNKNKEVRIKAYAAKGTYDEQMWSQLANKQMFIDKAMSGDPNVRAIEDAGAADSMAIMAGMVADDPRVLQLAGLETEINKLHRLFQAHEDTRASFRQRFQSAQATVEWNEARLPVADQSAGQAQDLSGDNFAAKVDGKVFTERGKWAEALIAKYKDLTDRAVSKVQKVGEISGFDIAYGSETIAGQYLTKLKLATPIPMELVTDAGTSPQGVAMRAQNAVTEVARLPGRMRERIREARATMDSLSERMGTPFPMKELLAQKITERNALREILAAEGKEKEKKEEQKDNPVLSRGSGSGMALRDLKAVHDRVALKMRNLPTVHVLESPGQAPKLLRDHIESAGAWNDVEGAMHDGEIYLFASGLADEARAEHVLAVHEVTHYGLRGAFGKDLDAALQHIWLNNGKVRKAAAVLKERNSLGSNIEAVEEVLADMKTEDLVKLSGWRRVVKAVRDWLRKSGAERLADRLDAWMKAGISEQEKADLFVADLVSQARAWVGGGKQRGAFGADTRLANLSRGARPIQPDTPAFKRWFGDSKVVDANGKPRVMYHGTTADIASFEEGITIYLAETGAAASEYARRFGYIKDASTAGEGGNVMPLYVKAEKPFDYKSKDDVKWLVQALKRADKLNSVPIETDEDYVPIYDDAEQALSSGDPYAYRSKDVQSVISTKYDSFYSEARGVRNLAVFSPAQVKSATGNNGDFDPSNPDIRMSRSAPGSVEARADEIITKSAATWRPVDAILRTISKTVHLDRATSWLFNKAGFLLDRYTPEHIKAGVVSDYGIPESVIDRRVLMQGSMKKQIRSAGDLINKLSTLTRAESRVAYEWMNNTDPQAAEYFEAQLPEESIKVMAEVRRLIDQLSQEAVRLGQLDPEAFKRNRFEYLRRSYFKHTTELTSAESEKRTRAISILGDQYKGRGMSDAVPMAKFKNVAPEWWGRKMQAGKADKGLKGEKFIRLERRAPTGEGVRPLEEKHGPGRLDPVQKGRLLETAYWPAAVAMPAKYSTWEKAGTWEVRDTKGNDLVLWRDFTKQERVAMGEIDEARYAIAKTLHGMIQDVETGKYLEWLAVTHAAKTTEQVPGKVVEASERMRDTFAPDEWVRVPDTKIQGTSVSKYGLLAGRYLPGPVWNDVRQTVGFRFAPFGETYAAILGAWKTSKTALSPAVHTNNVMANMVMADWHDVTAGHVLKALRILLASSDRDGTGVLGRTGNGISRAGIADRGAARVILDRFSDSGGNVGTWATAELQQEQLEPLLKALEKELGTLGQTQTAQVGVMVALQKLLQLKLPSAWEALKPNKAVGAVRNEAANLLKLYEAEDQVFRLAAWLKAKEDGANDLEAGKSARKSFLDYNINAPWVQAMRKSVFPFISFSYRAVPMMLETAAKKPWKLMKLGLLVGGINALGYLLSGGDEEEERRYLPEEKAGRIWGVVPKLVRMPWNDANGSPVFLDIRRFVPVGDIFDLGQTHSAIPTLPMTVPGGPMAILAELILNKSQFTGREIANDTDTAVERAGKVFDHLYKAFAPNILGLPGTYATTGVLNAGTGKTDAFGREQSTPAAVAGSFGVKLGSYPTDVLRLNAWRGTQASIMEIDRNITQLKREHQRRGIDQEEFQEKVNVQLEKKRKVIEKFATK